MVKITSPDGTASYSYDGDSLRVQATGDTAATGNLLYDRETDAAAPQLIADTNGSYTWTPAGQLSQQIGNTTSYTLADALGSTRALTDSSGAVTATVDYDVYGNVRNQTGTWEPYGYTAGIQTGSLVTLGERDLRTDIGQFLSTDPERPGGNGVTGWNQYTYVTNNPTTYVDPTGREMALEYTDLLKIGAVAVVGGYAISKTIEISVDALQRCLANTSCVLHPPAVTRPTSGTGNPAAGNPAAANPPIDPGHLQLTHDLGDSRTVRDRSARCSPSLRDDPVRAQPRNRPLHPNQRRTDLLRRRRPHGPCSARCGSHCGLSEVGAVVEAGSADGTRVV
jgi:RHS repeat-associated protein